MERTALPRLLCGFDTKVYLAVNTAFGASFGVDCENVKGGQNPRQPRGKQASDRASAHRAREDFRVFYASKKTQKAMIVAAHFKTEKSNR